MHVPACQRCIGYVVGAVLAPSLFRRKPMRGDRVHGQENTSDEDGRARNQHGDVERRAPRESERSNCRVVHAPC